MLIFYLFIISIVIYTILKIFLFEKINNERYYILNIAISSFLLMLFFVWVTTPLILAETIKMEVFWFTLLSLIIRLSPENVSLLFKGLPSETKAFSN